MNVPTFLSDRSALSLQIAAFDWASTPLGPMDQWPQSLVAITGFLLRSPVPIVLLWGADGTMIYNDGYAVIAGNRHPALLGCKVREGWPEVAAFNDNVMRIGMSGEALSYKDQKLQLNRSGRLEDVWFDLDYSPVLGDDHRPAGVIALVKETTDRVHVEAELRASEDNFETLTSAMPNHVWTSPPDGHLNWFNDQVYAYSGAAPGDLDGARWVTIVHPDDVQRTAHAWDRALKSGQTYEVEFRLRRADGSWRWHIARAVPVTGPSGAVLRWIGTNTDIDDQKRLADALADGNAQLERRVEERTVKLMEIEAALRQAQKMEAVGQLTGGIAHDFNNLLGGIGGALETIARRVEEGRTDRLAHYIEGAMDSVQRASSLTQRLLAFSRRQVLDPRATDVNRLVDGLEDLIRRTLGPGLALSVERADDLRLTFIDPSQMESALINLAINARDAMPDGGRMTITTENKTLDHRAAAEHDLAPGEYILVCVKDSGTGMTPDVVARAFDPFFTTKPIGKGTGLGLSMVHGFVRQSGGQVSILSEVGRGTTLCLFLPRFDGELSPSLAVDGDAIEPSRGESILVIDDEAIIRMLTVETLKEAGYQVMEAGTGPAGLKILESDATVDLLITDVGLPGGLNGREVADAARTMRPGLKVLFITGYAENAALFSGTLELGMQVLTKPFELTALIGRVGEMLHGTVAHER